MRFCFSNTAWHIGNPQHHIITFLIVFCFCYTTQKMKIKPFCGEYFNFHSCILKQKFLIPTFDKRIDQTTELFWIPHSLPHRLMASGLMCASHFSWSACCNIIFVHQLSSDIAAWCFLLTRCCMVQVLQLNWRTAAYTDHILLHLGYLISFLPQTTPARLLNCIFCVRAHVFIYVHAKML